MEIQKLEGNEEKVKRLKVLGQKRKDKDNFYKDYYNLSDFEAGKKYDSDYVSPYTKGSGRVDSDIFILLQDWASKDAIEKGLGKETVIKGYSSRFPTNKNLETLLQKTFNRNLSNVFTTNLFPYIKPGENNASIPKRVLVKAFEDFALPQIEIVKPRLVICCGAAVYNSAIKHLRHQHPFESHFIDNGIMFYHQSHPGVRGTQNAGGMATVENNWNKMRECMQQQGETL